MSVSNEISRINKNIKAAYTIAETKGAVLPSVRNSANLSASINTIIPQGEPVSETLLYKGHVETIDNLPTTAEENHVYTVGESNKIYRRTIDNTWEEWASIDQLVKDINNQITNLLLNYYTKEEVDQIIKDLGTLQRICGTLATASELPETANPGDTYIVTEDSSEYMYIGDRWEKLGPLLNLSDYDTSAVVDEKIATVKQEAAADATTKDAEILKQAKQYTDNNSSKLPTDLLHYKGHVETVDQLPSLGQPSKPIEELHAIITDNCINLEQIIKNSTVHPAIQEAIATGSWSGYGKYFVVACDALIVYNDPEAVKLLPRGDRWWVAVVGYHEYYEFNNNDKTYIKFNRPQIIGDALLHSNILTNTKLKLFKESDELDDYAQTYKGYKTYTNGTYTYNGDSYFLIGNVETGIPYIEKGSVDPSIKENDTYTVGPKNLMYVFSKLPNPAWNLWSGDSVTEAMVDEKDATTLQSAKDYADSKEVVLPSDLLHYKGHVETVDQLPSLGQPSAAPVEPLVEASSTLDSLARMFEGPTIGTPENPSYPDTYGVKAWIDSGAYKSYGKYFIMTRINDPSSGYAHLGFITDYPEIIKLNFERTDRIYTHLCAIATPEKPVYVLKQNKKPYQSNSYEQLSWEPWNYSSQNPYTNLPAVGFLSKNKGTGVPGVNADRIGNSYNYNGYVYDENSIMLSAGERGAFHFVKNEVDPSIKENDTYTVGPKHDIYVFNPTPPTWVLWSESSGSKLPTDILHYKGHVASESGLPSIGQPSGTLLGEQVDIVDFVKNFKAWSDTAEVAIPDAIRTGKYKEYGKYYLSLSPWASVVSDDPNNLGLYHTYHNGVQCFIPGAVCINLNKATYLLQGLSTELTVDLLTPDHTGVIRLPQVPRCSLIGASANWHVVSNIPLKLAPEGSKTYISYTDASWGSSGTEVTAKGSYVNGDYIYNPGMTMFISGTGNKLEIVGADVDPSLTENDLYTVGNSNMVYVFKANPVSWLIWGNRTAADIPYDNTASKLTATTVQSAIDELVNKVTTANATLEETINGGV